VDVDAAKQAMSEAKSRNAAVDLQTFAEVIERLLNCLDGLDNYLADINDIHSEVP